MCYCGKGVMCLVMCKRGNVLEWWKASGRKERVVVMKR